MPAAARLTEPGSIGIYHARVSRATVEAITGMSLVYPDCGKRLGQHGLLLFHAQGGISYLLGTNPDLAKTVNTLRYGPPKRGVESAALVQVVLGLKKKPTRQISDERLYDALSAHVAMAGTAEHSRFHHGSAGILRGRDWRHELGGGVMRLPQWMFRIVDGFPCPGCGERSREAE